MLNLEGLSLAVRMYGSWSAVARAGFHVDVMREYRKHQIRLNHEDIRNLKMIYLSAYTEKELWDLGTHGDVVFEKYVTETI